MKTYPYLSLTSYRTNRAPTRHSSGPLAYAKPYCLRIRNPSVLSSLTYHSHRILLFHPVSLLQIYNQLEKEPPNHVTIRSRHHLSSPYTFAKGPLPSAMVPANTFHPPSQGIDQSVCGFSWLHGVFQWFLIGKRLFNARVCQPHILLHQPHRSMHSNFLFMDITEPHASLESDPPNSFICWGS